MVQKEHMTNRTLNFRVWHKQEKRFLLDGEFAIDCQGGVYYVGNNCGKLSLSPNTYTEDVIIQQFSGFLDKNGAKIYEGDFLEIPEEKIGWDNIRRKYCHVWYSDVTGSWIISYNHFYSEVASDLYKWAYSYSVAGNIFQHESLMN